jgi:death on curing protein
MTEPVWLNLKAIVAAHDAQLAAHGGLAGVRDFNLLESALAKPQMAFAYETPKPDICHLAALYMMGISRNHPFNDANKRTAWLAGRAFLRLNGHDIAFDKSEPLLLMPQIAQGALDAAAVADWLRLRLT